MDEPLLLQISQQTLKTLMCQLLRPAVFAAKRYQYIFGGECSVKEVVFQQVLGRNKEQAWAAIVVEQ
jgi:hypothetical protein